MPHCTGGSCRQGRAVCATPEACQVSPDERRTFEPNYEITGPHRARKQRATKRTRYFLITFGVVAAGFFIARFLLRAIFPGVF